MVIAKGLVIQVDGDTKPLEKSLGKIGSVAQKGLGITVKGIAAISTGFAAATGASLKFRGELEQNLGGSKAVFKDFADDIQKNAEKAFSQAGLSASDYLATANKMGALFQGAGFTIQKSADLTAKAMQRAADVASIMGIETSWAMESIAGAAKGNFTMMDNLGVAMNETTLNAYALEKGLGKTTAQMTNQEKIGLAMELFLERTAYAAGNYAKENETLAGSLGTAKASLENFMSGAGNVDDVVDSVLNAGKVIAKNVKELLPELGQGLSDGLSQILAEIPGFIDDNADEFAEGAANLVMMLAEAIIAGTPTIVSAASKLLVAFTDKLGEAVPILKPITETIGLLGEVFEATTDSVTDSLEKEEKAYRELKATKDEVVVTELAEIARVEHLYDQLSLLADASGEVEEKDRGRVNFILNELNEALGTEYRMVDDVIQKYNELCISVEKLANQKRAEILLQNNEEAYNKAVMNMDAAVEAQADAYHNLKKAVEEANTAYHGLNFTVEEVLENGVSEKQMHIMANNNLHDLMSSINRYANTYESASEDVQMYSEDMSVYTEALAASQEGDFKKVIEILDKNSEAYRTSVQVMEEQSQKSLGELGENYARAVTKVETAYNTLLKTNNSVNQEALQNALVYAANMRTVYENAGGEVVDGYVTGMDGKKISLTDKTKEIMLMAAKTYGEDVSEFEKNGSYSVDGIIAGANSEENRSKLYNAYFSLGQLAKDAYNDGQDANSPAKEFVKASKNSIDGLIKGIDDNADRLIDRLEDLAGEAALAVETAGKDLLESELFYLSEKQRIEREADEREYRERLANAKTAEDAEKIKRDRLQELNDEANQLYLEELKATANAEREQADEAERQKQKAAEEARKVQEKAAEEARKKRVEAYRAATEAELDADERRDKAQRYRNQKSQEEYIATLSARSQKYKQYADEVLTQSYMTAEEQEVIREDWLKEAERLESEYLSASFEMDRVALDKQKSSGIISQREYWDKLAALRDAYFEEGSDLWLQYSEEIVTQQREEEVQAYTDAVETELDAEERKDKTLKYRNKMSQKEYVASLLTRAKQYREYADDILTQSHMTAEEQEEIREDWLKRAEELEAEHYSSSYEMDKAALDKQKKSGIISQREYWDKLAALRDAYFEEGSDLWLQYSEEIVTQQKEDITQAYTEIAEAAEGSLQDIENAQNALAQKLKGFGNVLKTITFKGAGEDGGDLRITALRDFKKENEALGEYREALEALRIRGKDILGEDYKDFFQQFSEMSITEGIDAVNAMLSASDDEFHGALSGWKEYRRNSEVFASDFYKNDYETLEEELMAELSNAFDDVPDGFIENGKLAADAFGEGFIERIQAVFDSIALAVDGEMAQMSPWLSGGSGSVAANNVNYHTVYNFSSHLETVQQQIKAARDAGIVKQLRG